MSRYRFTLLCLGALLVQPVVAAPAVNGLIFSSRFEAVPLTVDQAFAPPSIFIAGRSTLTVTLGNLSTTAAATLTDDLVDLFPAGLSVATPPNLVTTCAGSAGATAGGNTLTLAAGAQIPINAVCAVSVDVTATAPAAYSNLIAAGALRTNLGHSEGNAAAVLTVAAANCSPAQLLVDPSFEAGIKNPYWLSTSTNSGTALCDMLCGDNGLPNSGNIWAWMGGFAAAEDTTIEQTVVIPSGSTRYLNFYMWINTTGHPDAFLEVLVDGSSLATYREPTQVQNIYLLRTVNLSAYANGAAHTIRLHFNSPVASSPANFHVDDVTLDCAPGQQ